MVELPKDTRDSALIIIDAQNSMINRREGYDEHLSQAAENLAQLIYETRNCIADEHGIPIYHVAMLKSAVPADVLNKWSEFQHEIRAREFARADFIKGCEPHSHEAVFFKGNYSAMSNCDLPQSLKESPGIKTLFIGGFHTSACVAATAIDATHDGYNVFVIKEATCSVSSSRTREGIKQMEDAGVGIISLETARKFIWPKTPMVSSVSNPHVVRKRAVLSA